MAGPNSLEWEDQGQEETTTPSRPTPTEPEHTPEPWEEKFTSLNGKLDSLYQVVNTLASVARTQSTIPQQSATKEPEPYADWKDMEFLREEDALALLESKTPQDHLNRVLNNTAKTLHQNFTKELQKRDYALYSIRNEMSGQVNGLAQERQAEAVREYIYERHPVLRDVPDVVGLEWSRMASEAQANPYNFAGMSQQDVLNAVGTRAIKRLEQIAGTVKGGDSEPERGSQFVRGPARRARMEGSNNPRFAEPRTEKDPNKRSVAQFDKFMRG